MQFEWDADKNRLNLLKHGVGFEAMARFDWTTAIRAEDDRRDYGELRYLAYGRVEGRLYVCVYTQRFGAFRIISLRKANQREEVVYEKAYQTTDR